MVFEREVAAATAQWASAYGVRIDPLLVHAIIRQESIGGKVLSIVEPDGSVSRGPMHVKDSTAIWLGLADPLKLLNPATGIWYGVKYLAQQLRRFAGDVERAVSAYNAGPGRANRSAAGRFPNQAYVDRVMSFYQQFARAAVPTLGVLAVAALVVLLARRRRAA